MVFATEIKQYISQLKTKSGNPAGVQEQTRTENILNAFCERLSTWPNESDYEAFRATIDKHDNTKFATENINRVKKFFAWLKSREEAATMPEIEEYTQQGLFEAEADTAQVTDIQTWPEANNTPTIETLSQPLDHEASTENTTTNEPEEKAKPVPIKKKAGRKVFDTVNGEKKSEKLMMYFTPELIARIRAWCDMKGISNVSFITGIVEDFLKDKEDKINTFLKMRSEL